MNHAVMMFTALLLALPELAWAQARTPPEAGGPQPGRAATIGRDAGPAPHPPRTASPQAVNRGTDGSAVGLAQPGASGTTPQGMMGSSTAGARDPAEVPGAARDGSTARP